MPSRSGREVILGIGGGIAAYKACELVRRMKDVGYLVTVVPTPASLNFVGKATWEALSGRAVHDDLWQNVSKVAHVSLADSCDLIVIAPSTADLIAKIAHGRADDLLTNIVLASSAVKVLVPAMHPNMWLNPATVDNVTLLRNRGFTIIEPDIGALTGGDIGPGRFPSTATILENLSQVSQINLDFTGKRILITAGGTREDIDPVRFIGNRSSGKQGFALALAAASRGAQVELIAANCDFPAIEGVNQIDISSASQMQKALEQSFPNNDVLIMCAAVADARPEHASSEKIKKVGLESIALIQNPDLLATLTKKKKSGQVIVGFAAETQDHLLNAEVKLVEKGLDLLYVNDVSGGAIFGSDLTHGHLLDKEGGIRLIEQMSKDTLAHELLNQVRIRLS